MTDFRLDISVPVALDQMFTYLASEPIPRGCRVSVPFGGKNRQTIGVVLGPSQVEANSAYQLKRIIARIDDRPIYSQQLLELARWMSSYYLYPLGEVLRTMLPASRVKVHSSKVVLTEAGQNIWVSKEHPQGDFFRYVWKKSKSCSLKLFKARAQEALAQGICSLALSRLLKEGLVVREEKRDTKARSAVDRLEDTAFQEHNSIPSLTGDQQVVLCDLVENGLGKAVSKPFLLHGVTGAGKTEVYLHLIEKVLEEHLGGQVLVMVPEIALTPQMTRVFTARFPGLVSVVHSAMSDAERWSQIEAIRSGHRKILIGPRSAVFAPFESLKLIIVDEEHDGSYKQSNGLSYSGRDVAVMRAHIEKALVLLGSATPSLESYANAMSGKYNLLQLPNRVHGRGMPDVRLIEPEMDLSFARRLAPQGHLPKLLDLPINPKIIDQLRSNLERGMQSMVIVNRRGYAYFLLSLRDRKAVNCPHCSISMTVHKRSTLLRCHYCDFSQKIEDFVKKEDRDSYVMVGYGSEQMEVYLREALPTARIQRVDSDTVGTRESLPRILNDFRSGQIDILVGTQMLAKGHDFARVTLICILEIDQVLNLPDFRAAERAFQLMVQASGRAGRAEHEGCVMIQTQKPSHPVLQAGLRQDFGAFWLEQERFRRQHGYPPFGRMILFEFSGTQRDQLEELITSVDCWIKVALKSSPESLRSLQVLGPSVPPIEMIRRRMRRTLLLVSSDRRILLWFAQNLRSGFSHLKGDLRLRIDVDPQSLM